MENIEHGRDKDLDTIIQIKKNPANSCYKYSAWFGTWPCSIDGDDPEKVKLAAMDLADLIVKQIEDSRVNDNNYGLAFYACGYDGQAQNEFVKYYADEFGVAVF